MLSEIQVAELASKGSELSANQVQQKMQGLVKDFPTGALKKRMQKILRNLYQNLV
jgi:hypothetical protein